MGVEDQYSVRQYSVRFLACLPLVLAQECPRPDDWSNPLNFNNDRHDPGGKTFCGIIQREYDIERKRSGEPTRDVRKCTQVEGYYIFESNYWMPDCSSLSPGLDLSFFDESVNTGTAEATKVLQHVLGITVDGEWGPETDDAVKNITDVAGTIRAFADRREEVYKEMPGFKYFGTDWIDRAVEIRDSSLKMVGGTS